MSTFISVQSAECVWSLRFQVLSRTCYRLGYVTQSSCSVKCTATSIVVKTLTRPLLIL